MTAACEVRAVKLVECFPYDDREELKRRPLCRTCGGRDTAWAQDNEDDPRERLVCFTCEYGTPPPTCLAWLVRDLGHGVVSFAIGPGQHQGRVCFIPLGTDKCEAA